MAGSRSGTRDAFSLVMKVIFALASLAACQASVPSVPWLHGLSNAVASDRDSESTMRRLADESDFEPACGSDAYRGIELVADVSPHPGRETIVASYAQGIFVYDARDRLVAATPGYRCTGSADALSVLAAGDAHGAPTIVVVGTRGGRRESETWLGLFRIRDRRLHPTFMDTVEERRDAKVIRGAVVLLPGALIHRAPRGTATLYHYDPRFDAYVVPGLPFDDSMHDGTTVTIALDD